MCTIDALVIVLAAITSHLRLAQVSECVSILIGCAYLYITGFDLQHYCELYVHAHTHTSTHIHTHTHIYTTRTHAHTHTYTHTHTHTHTHTNTHTQLRFFQFVASKLQALEMMKIISHHITDECILERVIPYLVCLKEGHSLLGMFKRGSFLTWYVSRRVIPYLVCFKEGHSLLGMFKRGSFLTWYVSRRVHIIAHQQIQSYDVALFLWNGSVKCIRYFK